MITCTRKKKRRPVPWIVTCATSLLPDELSSQEWEIEVRKIIRQRLPDLKRQLKTPPFVERYDDRIAALIEDEVSCN